MRCGNMLRTLLLLVLLLITFRTFWAMYESRRGVVRCPCVNYVETEHKVSKYLPSLLALRSTHTNRTTLEQIKTEHPFLPIDYLVNQEVNGKRCSLKPGLFSIKHNNLYWQKANIGSTTYLLFSAILDRRDLREGPLIRILAVADSASPTTPFCSLYFSADDSRETVSTLAIKVEYLHWDYPRPGQWHPFIITCRAGTEDHGMADVVSVTKEHCSESVTNALTVLREEKKHPKKDLALCTKFVYDPSNDFSVRLVEWLEAGRAWGVDTVTIFVSQAHPNVDKVLRYYEATGFVDIVQWTNPGHYPNTPSLMRAFYDTQRYALFTLENIPYTHCLLTHVDTHRYVAVWDFDEFILPVGHHSISAMVDDAFNRWLSGHESNAYKTPPSSYLARGSYFFDDLIDTFTSGDVTHNQSDLTNHMLSHIRRTLRVTDIAVHTKAVHDTSIAVGLHAHFALIDLNGVIDRNVGLYHLYSESEAFLAHYRATCQGEDEQLCQNDYRAHIIEDKRMWLKGDPIYTNTKNVLNVLQLR